MTWRRWLVALAMSPSVKGLATIDIANLARWYAAIKLSVTLPE